VALQPGGSILAAQPAEPIEGPPQEGLPLPLRLIPRVRFHDVDGLLRTPVADVDAASEYAHRTSHQLRDLPIAPIAEGAAQGS